MGPLWTKSGCGVLFVDVNEPLVTALNTRGSYPIRITGDSSPRRWVPRVDACLVSNTRTVVYGLSACEFACTAVGVGVFSSLAPLIAQGIERRTLGVIEANPGLTQDDLLWHWEHHPLNIICCENQKNAGQILRDASEAHLPNDARVREYFDNHVGFVDASVGRMVPPTPPELLAQDPLFVLAEPYCELPIDTLAWKGTVPPIDDLLPKQNFDGYVARKLFTHNGGHALLAYEGFLRGYEFIWQCVEDAELIADLRGFWAETGAVLCAAYAFDPSEQTAHENDLLHRFGNKELGDTVLRVARDPARKLRVDDRLIGAARLCEAQGIAPVHVARALAAALQFDPPASAGDPSAHMVQSVVKSDGGVKEALATLSGVAPNEPLAERVAACFAAP